MQLPRSTPNDGCRATCTCSPVCFRRWRARPWCPTRRHGPSHRHVDSVCVRSPLCASSLRAAPISNPVVLHLDNAQWGDSDSAASLTALFRPPDAPRILLILELPRRRRAYGELLPRLRAECRGFADARATADIDEEPRRNSWTRRFSLERCCLAPAPQPDAAAIGRESRGVPFFIHELVRLAGTKRGAAAYSISKELVARRLAVLPTAARQMVEVIAVGGHPLRVDVAARAARIAPEDETEALAPGRGWRTSCGSVSTVRAR